MFDIKNVNYCDICGEELTTNSSYTPYLKVCSQNCLDHLLKN